MEKGEGVIAMQTGLRFILMILPARKVKVQGGSNCASSEVTDLLDRADKSICLSLSTLK